MLISQNPVFRAVSTITLFWYCVFFLLSGLYGVALWRVVYALPQSVGIAAAGAAGGFILAAFAGFNAAASAGRDARRGDVFRGATISLGARFDVPVQAMAGPQDALLAETPWWPTVVEQAPAHAEAIHAVLRAMMTMPRFPASPYPGGHGGRSLVEHSLAVASQVVVEAKTWVYEGQKDKRGRLRFHLTGDAPHRFTPADIPLLLLTGLAHDIGKLDCYDPLPGEKPRRKTGPVLAVVEVRHLHDILGARLLRRIPAVMALPRADRTALLTAVGYYHHPFGLPVAGWVTDRIRSLTELLAKADIAVGTAEGHTLLTQDEQDEWPEPEDGGEPSVAAPVVESTPFDSAGDGVDLDAVLEAARAAAKPASKPVAKPEPAKAATTAPSAATAAPKGLPPTSEGGRLIAALTRPNAVNGKFPSTRLAWKHGGIVYVMEPSMRKAMHKLYDDGAHDTHYLMTAFADDQNGAPWTLAAMEQLAAAGVLVTEHDGRRYSPRRAMFKMRMPSGSMIGCLMLRAEFIPGMDRIPDANPVTIAAPMWGDRSGKALHAPEADTPASDANAAEPADTPTEPAPATETADPFIPLGAEDDAATDAPPAVVTFDAAKMLSDVLSDPACAALPGIEWRRGASGDTWIAIIKIESEAGRTVNRVLEDMAKARPDAVIVPLKTKSRATQGAEDGSPTAFERAYIVPGVRRPEAP